MRRISFYSTLLVVNYITVIGNILGMAHFAQLRTFQAIPFHVLGIFSGVIAIICIAKKINEMKEKLYEPSKRQ